MKLLNIIKTLIFALIVLYFTGCEKDSFEKKQESEIHELKDGNWTAPNGRGQLTVENGIRILKLYGTNNEMGYTHGYLLAEEIIYTCNTLLIHIMSESESNYNELKELMKIIQWDNRYMEELEGMLSGIQDRLNADKRIVEIENSGHEISLDDLKILNSVSEWGCSSFTVWGNNRKDSSVLFARNFDYYIGDDDEIKNVHVIISYNDEIHNTWVTASICGFIGCITGMNSHGMALAIHDNNYYETSDDSGYIPRCLILRRIAEESKNNWTPDDVENMMDTIKSLTGINLHIAFPSTNRSDNEIAGVVEFDGNALHPDGRATLRSSQDNSSLYYNENFDQRIDDVNTIVCTNHYSFRKDLKETNWDSLNRYVIIKNMLNSAKSDGDVSVEEALDILKEVGDFYTVHSVIFEPYSKLLRFYLAKPYYGGFESPVKMISYDELF